MNVFGFVSNNDRFRLEATGAGYELLTVDQISVTENAIVETGLLLYPPAGTTVVACTPPDLNRRGITVHAIWERGKPLIIRMDSGSRTGRAFPVGGPVVGGSSLAWLTLVKVTTPRLARWTSEVVQEKEQAQTELKKMMMPPKPISVMGTQRRAK